MQEDPKRLERRMADDPKQLELWPSPAQVVGPRETPESRLREAQLPLHFPETHEQVEVDLLQAWMRA